VLHPGSGRVKKNGIKEREAEDNDVSDLRT
jgi:hypothetical protein